jgi:hypothetical protein
MQATFNPNELVIDKVRFVEFTDLTTNEVIAKLTQLEDPALKTTAENDSIVDAVGAEIMKLYKAKKATFTASNSLFSMNLLALQIGSDKQVASDTNKIDVPVDETLTIAGGKAKLSKAPKGEFRYVYVLNKGTISTKLEKAEAATAGKFAISDQDISVDTATVPDGTKVYVEYTAESANAVKIINKAEDFPKAVGFKASVLFRDPCTESTYLGAVLADKAKLDPSDIEASFKRDGKHSFTVDLFRNYCEDNGELYSFVVAQD